MNARCPRRFPTALAVTLMFFSHAVIHGARAQSADIVGPDTAGRVAASAQPRGATGEISSATNALMSTLGASRQIAAYAKDRLLPSAMCVYAEQVKREWLQMLNASDHWRDPILILVRAREPAEANAPAISLETYQTDEHLKYQIYCLVPPPLDDTVLLPSVVEALCAEWANRDQPVRRRQGYAVPRMPSWLVQGMAASIQGRGDLLLSVARRSVAAGRPQEAADLLNTKWVSSDPTERGLFQANAWMFTEGLLGLPDGAKKLQRFLTELGTQKVASNAFWTVYRNEFPQGAALERWWSLQQARHTTLVVAEEFTARETALQLDEVLLTKLDPTTGRRGMPGAKVVTIDQLWHYYDEPWLRDVLDTKINRLAELRSQAHPLYRPVIDAYSDALGWLKLQSTVRFRRGVRKAEAKRLAAEKRSQAIAAYLDQAERVYDHGEFTKVFAGYFRTLDRFQTLENERQNPISNYLDRFDKP